MDRQQWQAMVTRHKTALTRAKKTEDPQRIITTCEQALNDFEAYGYPDQWADWDRERMDAVMAIQRNASW